MALTAEEATKLNTTLEKCTEVANTTEEILTELQNGEGRAVDITAAVAAHNNSASAHSNMLASPTQAGLVSTGSQTFAGNKTFTGYTQWSSSHDYMRHIITFDNVSEVGGIQTEQDSVNFLQGIYYANKEINAQNMLTHIGHYIHKDGHVSMRIQASSNGVERNAAAILISAYATNANVSFIGNALPTETNTFTIGNAGKNWKEIFCANATINTSDEREKSNIAAFPDEVLDAWGEVNFQQFQFNAAVQEKGANAARIHSGVIAQRVMEVFQRHGLDASRYGLFCYDEWAAEPEQKDEEGNVMQPALEAGNRYGIRYAEALCLEAAYQRRRADRIEARLADMESRLAALEGDRK